jgi:TRAP-type mannitol/chloroaromatic compound transport system permease small subunit
MGDLIGKLASFLMVFIVLVMVASAFVRYYLRDTINYLGIVPNMFFIYVCLGAAYAYNQRAFVTVDVLYRRLPVRARAALDLVTSLFFFTFLIVLVRVSQGFALPALAKFSFDPMILIAPDRWPITILFPLGPILMLIAGSVRFFRNLLILITGVAEPTNNNDVAGRQETSQ